MDPHAWYTAEPAPSDEPANTADDNTTTDGSLPEDAEAGWAFG
jgi:hypothetical protein